MTSRRTPGRRDVSCSHRRITQVTEHGDSPWGARGRHGRQEGVRVADRHRAARPERPHGRRRLRRTGAEGAGGRERRAARRCGRPGPALAWRRRKGEWEALRRQALQPTIEFLLARRLVEVLRSHGPLTEAQLARALGARADSAAFLQAVQYAAADRRAHADDGLWQAATPDALLGEDTLLRDMGYVDELVECVSSIAGTAGAITREELLELTRATDGPTASRSTASTPRSSMLSARGASRGWLRGSSGSRRTSSASSRTLPPTARRR